VLLDADASLATLANAAQGVESTKPVVKIRYTLDEVEFNIEQFLALGQLCTIFWHCGARICGRGLYLRDNARTAPLVTPPKGSLLAERTGRRI